MKISVVIPTYNSSKFIRTTLESVFLQTLQPHEVLILDDGSVDDTVSILNAYKPRVTVFERENKGVAAARNELCRHATGELIAFLDHDDIWHPCYLELQSRQIVENPSAVVSFTLHRNFSGFGGYEWNDTVNARSVDPQVIIPQKFIERYNNSTGTFYSMSFCCIPRWALTHLGDEPFCETVSGVDDCYICNLLILYGPVIFLPIELVAYRVTPQAQSINQLKNFRLVVQVFEQLEERYISAGDPFLLRAFYLAFAGKRRRYAKTLMGEDKVSEARTQFRRSMSQSRNPVSIAKSLLLLCTSYLPAQCQPRWPSGARGNAKL